MSDERGAIDPVPTTRRALLAGAGAVGASVVLAACGDGSAAQSQPAPGGAGEPGTTGGAQGGGVLAKTSDIPVGGGAVFAEQRVVITQPTQGTFKGFSAICTHQNCPVSSVADGTINCTCHGSRYSIEDGSVRNGPATRGLAAKKVKVSGDSITLA